MCFNLSRQTAPHRLKPPNLLQKSDCMDLHHCNIVINAGIWVIACLKPNYTPTDSLTPLNTTCSNSHRQSQTFCACFPKTAATHIPIPAELKLILSLLQGLTHCLHDLPQQLRLLPSLLLLLQLTPNWDVKTLQAALCHQDKAQSSCLTALFSCFIEALKSLLCLVADSWWVRLYIFTGT